MDSQVKINFRKTRKGKINKIVEEVYLREDIEIPFLSTNMEIEEKEPIIFVIDTETYLKQIDLIENCPTLNNVVVFQTILEELRDKNLKVFESVKNLVEIETHRSFYMFANEYFKPLFTPLNPGEKGFERNERAILKATKWFDEQAKLHQKRVVFLTNSVKAYETAQSYGIDSQTIYDYIQDNCKDLPDLLDYLGFSKTMEIEEEETGEQLFEDHLPQEVFVTKVKKGELFEGKLTISRDNVEEGRIFLGKYGIEVKIFGFKNLNRALNGDQIALELLPEKEWKKMNFAELGDDLDEKEDEGTEMVPTEGPENESMRALIEKIKAQELTPTGRVVGVIKRLQRSFCGQLKPLEEMRDTTKEFEVREFIPADSRFPNFLLKIRSNGALDTKKIITKVDTWSKYQKLPQGHFVSVIGEIGDAYTEGNVILLEHNVEIKNFSKKVYDCLPSEGENWKIPEDEYKRRKDFRDYCVCSIDPPGCKDIDDALHCRQLPNGNYEVGVHIADVTYFVKADSAIDKEAANRCTTVYLVGRRTDMLPKLLTETLCSLKSNVERLTFSVVWEMTPNAEVVNVEFMKGVIKSRAALEYKQAQKIIEDPTDNSEVAQSVKGLYKLAKIIRQRRMDAGALSLASTQVQFSFSDETHNPTDVSFYNLVEANYVVEEFMLFANIYVAEKILYNFPSNSILRKHSVPKPKQIKELAKLLNSLGYNLDYSSSKNLADSLDLLKRQGDPFFNKLVRILTTRTMNEANYFCTANFDYPEFRHYGLACSCYTHFTSPIRRYADVLVHRLLAAAIDVESLPKNMCNKQQLTKLCDKMNMRNRNARNASRASSDYHTYLFFRGKVMEEEGVIMSIGLNGFSVMLPKYGLEGFIQLSPENEKIHQARIKNLLEQDSEQIVNDVVINGTSLKIFDKVSVRISVELEHFHKKINVEYIKKL